MWKRLYNTSSVSDFGTLVQLRNLINRRNVVSDPKADFSACDDFFTLVVTCHFLTVIMKKLGMIDLDDAPSIGYFTQDSWMMSKDDRKSQLYSFCQDVIAEYTDVSLSPTNTESDDNVQEYAKEIMTLGILYLNYKDAIKEGDGERVLTIWKYLLPIFRLSERRNYSVEVLLTLYNYYFVFSPRQAKQLLWSRFINTHGLIGRNIPADLHMEHLNRMCKEAIKGLGANKTPKAITRIGKAIGPIHSVLNNFDNSVLNTTPSGKHGVASSEKDRDKVVTQLLHVLDEQQGRCHSCFENYKRILLQLDQKKFNKWITEHVESWNS